MSSVKRADASRPAVAEESERAPGGRTRGVALPQERNEAGDARRRRQQNGAHPLHRGAAGGLPARGRSGGRSSPRGAREKRVVDRDSGEQDQADVGRPVERFAGRPERERDGRKAQGDRHEGDERQEKTLEQRGRNHRDEDEREHQRLRDLALLLSGQKDAESVLDRIAEGRSVLSTSARTKRSPTRRGPRYSKEIARS